MDNQEKKEIVYIPIEDIIPNRFQPRLAFDERELNELSNSIIKYGVIQPVVVRKTGEKYEIIAGERRYKASTLAGLSKIPAIITNTDDNTSAEIALLENIQRKNLTVIEEAKSFKKLMDRGFTQESLALKLGISQSSIANKVRLLNLPKKVQDALLFNKISERHARSLLTINDEEKQLELLDRIINDKLTVKQTEDEISAFLNKGTKVEEKVTALNVYDSIPAEVTTQEPAIKVERTDIPERIELPHEIEHDDEPVVSELNVYDSIPEIEESEDKLEPIKIDNDIVPEIKEEKEEIRYNPFLNNIPVQEITNIPSPVENNEEKVTELNVYDSIPEVEEIKEIPVTHENHFVKTIDSIRNCISSLNKNSNITTTELDLDGKYQIIIEIDKENM